MEQGDRHRLRTTADLERAVSSRYMGFGGILLGKTANSDGAADMRKMPGCQVKINVKAIHLNPNIALPLLA